MANLNPLFVARAKSALSVRRALFASTGISYKPLCRKLGATLAATSRENCTTSTCSHASTEAMFFGATACVWLKGAFCHYKLLILKIYCGSEIRGKQGCNGRGLGISGSNWLFGVWSWFKLWITSCFFRQTPLLFTPVHR